MFPDPRLAGWVSILYLSFAFQMRFIDIDGVGHPFDESEK